MSQHKFQIKLASGLIATGLIDVLNGVKDAMGITWTKSMILTLVLKDLESNTDDIIDKNTFHDHIDKILSDPKHKYVLAIYGCKVY